LGPEVSIPFFFPLKYQFGQLVIRECQELVLVLLRLEGDQQYGPYRCRQNRGETSKIRVCVEGMWCAIRYE
jgi:hypothetical protein